MTILVKLVWMLFFTLLGGSLKVNCYPKGPWRLAFKVVGGKWNASTMGTATFWELFTSANSYSSSNPIQDQRDFTATSDHYKSSLVEDWENKHISVQAIKLSFFKGNKEKAYIVFNGVDKTKESWFKCDNIMYSSYTDLDDTNTLGVECPGKSATGLPLTIMKTSYLVAQCTSTTGWVVVADTNLGFSICEDSYLPTTTEPYFKYSNIATVADLTTQLEEADSIGIFFQVWDMVFKGVESVQPSEPSLRNLTGLFTSDLTQNDDSDYTVQNLQHNQGSQIFKSHVVNMWDYFHIETVKYALFKSGEEKAFFVFDAINTDKTSWFSQQKLLYSSYGDSLKKDTQLAMCSIDGDTYRNWQIQSTAGDINGCTDVDQMGWTLIKEFKNNGTCSWDTNIKKKPYFQYNAGTGAAVNPENFQFADVMAVFVQGWRLVLKVSAGGSLGSKSSIYALWTESGDMNENNADAMGLAAETETYKSAIIDQWTTLYIRAVRIAAYKDGSEVFNVVFDATGSSNTDWLDCDRILYTSVSMSASDDVSSYTCSIEGDSFRFMVGKTPSCGAEASLTGILAVADKGSTCSERTDLPQFLFSNTLDESLTDSTAAQLADTFAVFVDMASCYDGLCANDAACQDIGGNYRCICTGSYYGNTCANLDGTYSEWSEWSTCSVTCGNGSITRTRTCSGTAGDGLCVGDSEESKPCTLDPCPINGGYSEWTDWTTCTLTCGSGTQTRSRSCTNPAPQNGGQDCVGDATGTQSCNVDACPINGGLTEWTEWGGCSLTCGTGQQERTRTCTNPAPQNGGQDCDGSLTESQDCNTEVCPVNGGYTEWVEWSACTKTCGSGTQSRTRTCTNPVPANGGIDCVGDSSEEQSCSTDPCPVDGGLTEWTAWGGCSLPCGTGQQERTRTCTNPAPQNGGQDCDGSLTESQDCNTELCPIHGGFTDWGDWTDCTVACGSGTQSRSRACTNPAPENGGDDCVGETTDEQSCNTNPCPVDGVLSDWSEWITCPVTCGGGTQSRSRTCTAPQNGGQDCTGDTTESQDCNTDPCPVDGVWSDWTVWGACSTTCGNGIREHNRTCTPPENGGKECEGDASETSACDEGNCPPVDGGWTEWSDWSNCTKPCGRGDQSKSRTCTNPEPQWGGQPCVGGHTETHYCNDFVCPVDGGWGVWTNWVPCYNMTNDGCVSDCECGDGYNSRNRTCDSPIPQYEGKNCTGNNSEIASCTVPCCGPDMQTPCENKGSTSAPGILLLCIIVLSILVN